ncbi:MAG: bifunctional alpha/beta hydrolase/OsmC family protein [Verrucomicrobiales bacterium]|nr:bifunctional alpha/beta hydrolase/OsmC family protein [Verrucomicrobiales bacterium]
MRSENHQFPNSQGHQLAARLDLPGVGKPRAYLLFAHCFTCGKDLKAVRSISEALTDLGIAVFRFDFPGLGQSEGEFSDSTFSSNVDDLYRAALYLEEIAEGPQILIGHSLGGAAVLRAAPLIESVRAVATIGAPSDPVHVTHLLAGKLDEIREKGEATVSLARREFLIRQEFVDDLEKVSTEDAAGKLREALLILHSPVDEIVGIDNAGRIYDRAKHPKSFVSLDDADHLLTREADAHYAARTIAAWAERYLTPETTDAEHGDTVVRLHGKGFRADVWTGGHRLVADEPASIGGTDAGPAPYDFLLSSLGTCTAMTLRMYADHKKWPLQSVEVRLRHDKRDETDEAGKKVRKDTIEREILVEGNLDEEQRNRLLEIADKCPVHRSLESKVEVSSKLVS